ncbi:MAG: Gfo/Idh/MocA family oxidoreductase, partial [Nitrospirae bacterium]
MNRLVRVGIIGLGFGARVHLPAFQSLPNVRVIAVADAGSGKADRVEVEHKGIRAFHDWRHMIANVESDAVSVATPPDVQQGIVCAALAAGKHVLSEKPFGTDVSAARAMLRAAQMSGRIHAIDFQFRMEPGIRGLKRQISLGKIGRVIRIDVTWLTAGRSDPALPFSWQNDAARGGGVLNNFGSHVIDYVEWISASRITTVNASARIIHAQRFDADGCEHTVTAEDSCDMTCALANGAIARVHFS